MINNIVILGIQWGDEGKGKIVDLLSKKSDFVVRYQGGNNAGHTLLVKKKKIILHLIPSCVLHKNVTAILGNNVVVSLKALLKEINHLKERNIFVQKRLILSNSLSLIFKYHISIDQAREDENRKSSIGTTNKGIGPAYEDKIARRAIRISDLYNKSYFKKILKKNVEYYNFQLLNFYHKKVVSYKKIFSETIFQFNQIKHMIGDVSSLLNSEMKNKSKIIFEGAQGSLLDIDHGTYPYVSSSNSSIGGVCTGTGIGIKNIDYVLGVSKFYSTRVGNGPFPTELSDKNNDHFSFIGKEFGATTGRKRRTGWLDLVILKRMININSLSGLCLTKLDVLDGLKEIKVCIQYFNKITHQKFDNYPLNKQDWKNIIPIYKIFKGWKEKTRGIKNFDQLPKNAKRYINFIQKFTHVSIDLISTGPERDETIFINHNLKNFI
ncbi:adenylosuccinate synthase [Buchnera aphidicola]|uniref:adenylosuccinate synthase n=1 Tax=Buchnera aphidicola TaxID=9 RepID=UPI0020932300|nr:adenylosuccinate synthase [Buchnera aphidicola]USS94112.1 adenylosuccinate synthase [Buchnera aphidicola (Sipha maydis)]WII23659.1 adenylosuccinate synthase [Buchnera aphidicola (Sipha maydis)]